ncbi:hypothetical protein [Pseudoalteromonas sp. NGC95]|uniref:hypothetical protein n=1 Tax=Pseudoalteromonas sp. NGC95 TaxID=2792051 RepID=UPI0018CC9C7D|nr:hypothetical protein [Pseudoalteromonas sp. NGC95]MBH0017883.1 hypothetical protein [Pseudoalteromonas sp. NGC95]
MKLLLILSVVFITLKGNNFPEKTLSNALIEAALINHKIKNGIRLLAERTRQGQEIIVTINDLFSESLKEKSKNPPLLERQFTKDIKHYIDAPYKGD